MSSAAPKTHPVSAPEGRIKATARAMRLPAGAYAISALMAPESSDTLSGTTYPKAHVAVLGGDGTGKVVGFSEGCAAGWLQEQGDVVFALVPEGGEANLLMTTYSTINQSAEPMKLAVAKVARSRPAGDVSDTGAAVAKPPTSADRPTPHPVETPVTQAAEPPVVQTPGPGVSPRPPAVDSTGVPLVALRPHVQNVGDRTYPSGQWAGEPGRGLHIEGFAVQVTGGSPSAFEYQVFDRSRSGSDWTAAPDYAGTRRRATPLYGVAFRLAPPLAENFDVIYQAQFRTDGKSPVQRNGQPCLSQKRDDPLVGVRVSLVAKAGV